jgi:hypothetical protein
LEGLSFFVAFGWWEMSSLSVLEWAEHAHSV